MQEIINYIGAIYAKYTSDSTEGLQDLELDDPIEPVPLNPTEQVAFEIWNCTSRNFIQRSKSIQTSCQVYTTWSWGNVPSHCRNS